MKAAHTTFAGVSFARTPLDEIGAKDAEIRAAGWMPYGVRRDPWMLTYEKVGDPPPDESELVAIMGTYWVDVADVRDLLRNT